MGLQSVGSVLYHPIIPAGNAGFAPNYILATLDAADEKVGFIVQATEAGTIRKVGFPVITHTTSGDVEVRLETNSSGLPSGTLLDASATVTVTASATGWITADFGAGNGATVSRGDLFWVVIVADSTSTPDLQLGVFNDDIRYWFPYYATFSASWSKQSGGAPMVALELSTGSYMSLLNYWPAASFNTHTFNNGSDPDHMGMKFRFPFSCRVCGFWLWIDVDANADIKLYDSDGSTVLESLSVDLNDRAAGWDGLGDWYFVNSEILTADTFYRLVVEPTSASDISIYSMDVDSAAILDVMPGGQDIHHTEKKDAAWTDTLTRRPFMGLLIDQLDDGAGNGGGSMSSFAFRMGL